MHSRKSIFYKGLIFILSFFATIIFSYSSVKAEDCKVSFKDDNQYLIVSGDHSKWNDSAALIVAGDDCSDIKVNSITVNGQPEAGTKFTTAARGAGHYTVGYNYSYSKTGSGEISGTIYRYVRVLNSNFDTSNNYTLATFAQTGNVIESFNIGNNHFANFVVTSSDTYVVIKDVLGNDIASSLITAGAGNSFVAKEVVMGDSYFYLVGNDVEGDGFLIAYNVAYASGTYTLNPVQTTENNSAVYNSGYYFANRVYVVGKNDAGYPIIDVYSSNAMYETNHTYSDEKGEFLGVSVSSDAVYAVGYLKADNSNVQSDLFAYVSTTVGSQLVDVDVLKDPQNTISNTIFYDVAIMDDGSLVIVGNTTLVDINANGNYAANQDSRYSDALVLKVSSDGTVLRNVKMVGTVNDDAFTKVQKYDEGKYFVTGVQNNSNGSLVYILDEAFELTPHLTNGNSAYKVNGIVAWNHGEVYFGKISAATVSVLNMYYVGNNTLNVTPLFVSLDTRTFDSFNSINLIQNNKYAICDYQVQYGTGGYHASNCDTAMTEPETGSDDYYKYFINTSNLGSTGRLDYLISTQTGASIFVYRVIEVTEEPLPEDFINYETGILRWYVYNRPYTYSSDATGRLDSTYLNYSSVSTIEDIAREYARSGAADSSVSLRGVANEPQVGEVYKTFDKHTQNTAAFASLEYARQFAYYLEFSRVVRVEDSTVDKIGATRYQSPASGTSIKDGATFYVYYIDYKGSAGLINECEVTPTSVNNCSKKGGYAFASLNDLRIVIEYFLTYNNFFVSTRNTIYNGSIPESTLDLYYQDMYTTEYLKNTKIDSTGKGLTINVEKDGELVYAGIDKNVYFGGSISGGLYTYPNPSSQFAVTKVDENDVFYQNDTGTNIVFTADGHYKVYYTYVNNDGEPSEPGIAREFILDNSAPIIVYDKDSSAINSTYIKNDGTGSDREDPLFIESGFSIYGLDDLDDYAFITVNGQRYPNTCSNDSESCLNNIKQYILRRFDYNPENLREVISVTFSDRLQNSVTFYFVVGTKSPIIEKTSQTDDGFVLEINFENANPIITSSVTVVSQSCTGESGGDCYDPEVAKKKEENKNQNPLIGETNVLAFNQALMNYILAVSYRDNERAKHQYLENIPVEGIYTIGTIKYIVDAGYFVEVENYGYAIEISQDKVFDYGSGKYFYDEIANSIYTMKIDDDGSSYIVDDSIESIPLLNNDDYTNVFKFEGIDREFRIDYFNGKLAVIPIPKRILMEHNKFVLDGVEYEFVPETLNLKYKNPEIGKLKNIVLDFRRTIVDAAGVIVANRGVNIPLTEPLMQNGVQVVDSITNQKVYVIVEGKYVHFDLVDGSYTFTITENFYPYQHQVKADINVADLEVDLGVAKEDYVDGEGNPDPLSITDKTSYDFDLGSDSSTAIALRRLDTYDNYPLDPSIVYDSNLQTYSNTYFVDRTFYMGIKFNGMSVLVLKIYNELNDFGIPVNATVCSALVIYGESYAASPLTPGEVGCPSASFKAISYPSLSNDDLAPFGAKRVVDDGSSEIGVNKGFFAFNKEFTFYEITLTAYEDRSGTYVEVANPITNYIYIDSVGPDDDNDLAEGGGVDRYKDSITTDVYNDLDGEYDLADYSFSVNEEGVKELSNIVGANSHVRFHITFNKGLGNDARENKMLYLTINDGTSDPPMCNIYELIDNGVNYETACKLYVDLVNSVKTADGILLVFSATGVYNVSFSDASHNSSTYSFVIDKEPPRVAATGAFDKVYNGLELVETEFMVSNVDEGKLNYVLGYVKNPLIKVRLDDLIGAGQYCYRYYSILYKNADYECFSTQVDVEEYEITMPQELLDILVANKFNGDVILFVYGVDNKNNGTSEDAITIHFWVDYAAASAPEEKMTKVDLNETEIVDAKTKYHLNTVSVYSSDYSGQVIECLYDFDAGKYLFAFVDKREGIRYTFNIECQDLHGNESDIASYSKGFTNSIYMKFYETDSDGNRIYDDDTETYEIFNFGLTNDQYYAAMGAVDRDADARWVYITLVDGVGNESDLVILLPIFVEDKIKPEVEGAYKQDTYDPNLFTDLEAVSYEHIASVVEGFNYTNEIYLANTAVKLTYSEPIYSVVTCLYVTSKDSYMGLHTCGTYPNGKTYKYSARQVDFLFENYDLETTRIYVFIVEDFATHESKPVIVIIDRTNPTIDYRENGKDDHYIEYNLGAFAYDDTYMNSTYDMHVEALDDQPIGEKVFVSYQRYMPKYTYNNYIKQNNEYKPIDNYIRRANGQKYYLLINKEVALANNKQCVATTLKSNVTYCYVEDTQAFYYFDSLLEDDERFWEEVEAINNTTVGVYRVSYYVRDYAGNVSDVIYKKVIVTDTYNPDVELLDTDRTVEYRNVTTANEDGFQGKLNKSVIFRGIDTTNQNDSGVKLVLYKCDTGNYKKYDGEKDKCYIKEQYLYSAEPGTPVNPSRNVSTSNEWNLGVKLTDGVYKMYAYDGGGYHDNVLNNSNVYYDNDNTGNKISSSETIYSRDYNTSHFYFAINIGETGANYVVHGNKYTSQYTNHSLSNTKKGFTFEYNSKNYYTITHKNDVDRDVYLVLENENGTFSDISKGNAIGASGFIKNKAGGIITYTYTNSAGDMVYEVIYEPYSVSEGLFLHETYHNVNYEEGTAEVCMITNGINPCEALETVYKVTSVTANIYEEGTYTLRMMDRYGNVSPEVSPLIVDNIGHTLNKDNNPATGVNYWFSVPSVPVNGDNIGYFTQLNLLDKLSNINVLEAQFEGNFNSEFFYAFASSVQAKQYLSNIYKEEINRVFALSSGDSDVYSLVNTRGVEIEVYRESDWTNGENVVGSPEFSAFISTLIYPTYVGDNSFDDEEINQLAYSGPEAISSMYEYASLKVTETINGGIVTRSYELITSGTCQVTDAKTQKCIKVSLRIVNKGTEVTLDIDASKNSIICKSANAGGSSGGSGTNCNIASTISGATYVFIDTDDVAGQITRYHSNEVYFGVVSYSETAEIEYSLLGEFVPLSKFERYANEGDSVSDPNGKYIWLNSEYKHVDSIMKTDLYASTCKFNNQDFSDCVYVTYVSTYAKYWDEDALAYKYIPSSGGQDLYYYNYYDANYYTKEDILTALGQDMTFSSDGNISSGGAYVPIATTIKGPITTDLEKENAGIYTNKKMYIELFNETRYSKLFEVKRVSDTEIYSYASLKINGAIVNINDPKYLVVNKDGTYRCIIDLPMESSYIIEVIDRAGNKFKMVISHSNTTPELSYQLDNETLTTSGAQVHITTDSSVASFAKNKVTVYKYNTIEDKYVKTEDGICIGYLQETLDNVTPVRALDLVFKNVVSRNCSGAYKVTIMDNHGNSNYIEFIFNPYDLTTDYIIDEKNNKIHTYVEPFIEVDGEGNETYNETLSGVIVSKGFKVEIDTEINYMVINKYDAHSNWKLADKRPEATIEIKDFSREFQFSEICKVTMVAPNNGKVYSVYINAISGNHDCDGVYTVDIYNRFADEVLNDVNIRDLQGANKEKISYRVGYAFKYDEKDVVARSIEIDTVTPPSSQGDFFLHIDEGAANEDDTATLLQEKIISYTNKYITISWGGVEGQSFAYLKYRVNASDDSTPWNTVKDNVTYYHDYTASYEFRLTNEGEYRCEFMFVDAVGNEDASQIFTINISIEPPAVDFYEVISGDSNTTIIVGNAYPNTNIRIGDRTILKCTFPEGEGVVIRDCKTSDYNYRMTVNTVSFPGYSDNYELRDIISHNSPWLRTNPSVREQLELNIVLTVSVKGKDDIKKVLSITIDKKAPKIELSGTTVGSTYTGNIIISLTNDDSTNHAYVYKCDIIEGDRCLVYNQNKELVDNTNVIALIEAGQLTKTLTKEHTGYFMVVAQDDLGNTSRRWFVLDNEAPRINVTAKDSVIAPGMYTNAKSVMVAVDDALSSKDSRFEIEFVPFDEKDTEEVVYNSLVGLTKEGKYTLTPIDGVNLKGRSITFYIYRQAPKYTIKTNQDEDPHVVNTEATLSWSKSENELVAPIVSVTLNGKMYNAVYNSQEKTYTGETIKDIGEHTFVITDSAGNRSSTMVTINNSKKVCINGIEVEVKMQAYYNVNDLNIGHEKGVLYEKNDVVIFALPSQSSTEGCSEAGLLGYRTLDPENSHYLIDEARNAELFNNNKYDFVANKFISEQAINEVNNVGGTVVVFVVTKDIANKQLGYNVGTNFFLEDPIGWSMIFVVCASMIWPAIRIFVKKKVKVI